MENSVAEIIKIIKASNNAIEMERKLIIFFAQFVGELMRMALEAIDDELQKEWREKGYRVERSDTRTIQFLFGAVTFTRRRMKKPGETGVYALDQSCGFEKGKRYSLLVQRQVAELSTKVVYRGVEKAVELFTSFTMSHGQVKNIVDQIGAVQGEWTNHHLEELSVRLPENRQVPVLVVEGDGLLIKGTKKKRKEIHRVQVSEGVERNGKRTELVRPYYFSSLKSSADVWQQLETYLSATYDLSNTIVLSNVDGGSGYCFNHCEQAIGLCRQHIHFIDRYHVHAKIKSRLGFCKDLEKPMKQAVWAHEWEQVVAILDTAESRVDEAHGEDQLRHIEKLTHYLSRNWAYLKRLKAYQLEETVQGIGSCESNHRIYSYRMKRNGKYWSDQGAQSMVCLIEALKNQTFDQALTEEIPEYEKTYPQDLKLAVRMALRKGKPAASVGAKSGRILHRNASDAMGNLHKAMRLR